MLWKVASLRGIRRFTRRLLYIKLIGPAQRDLKFIADFSKKRKLELKQPLKVAYLRAEFWLKTMKAGGAVAHAKGVVEGFSKLRCRVLVFSSYDLEFIENTNIFKCMINPEVLSFGFGELQELEYNRQFIKCLRPYLLREKPSFIYQRYGLNGYAGAYLAQELKIPFVMEYNGSEIWMAEYWGSGVRFKKIMERIELANFAAADLIIANASPLKEELVKRGVAGDKIEVIPNGADVERFKPDIDGSPIRRKYGLDDDTVVVAFIGSFGPWHGTEVLARSVKSVIEKNARVHFLFIGAGKKLAEAEEIVREDKVQSHVTFTGIVPQLKAPEYLAACDILVSPQIPNPDGSAFFGSPTKLFEYMAMGKGIVASNLDQIGQVMKHRQTAILVRPNDAMALADGIVLLAQDGNLRNQLGLKARQDVVARYTWEKHVATILEKLKELVL